MDLSSFIHPSAHPPLHLLADSFIHPFPDVPIHLSISVHIDLSTSARSPPHPSPVHGSSCCTQPSQLTLRSSLPGASIHRSSILAHIPPSISSQTSPPVRLWIWFLLIHPSSHLCTPLSVAALTPPSTPSPASFTCPSLCTTPALHLSSHSIHPSLWVHPARVHPSTHFVHVHLHPHPSFHPFLANPPVPVHACRYFCSRSCIHPIYLVISQHCSLCASLSAHTPPSSPSLWSLVHLSPTPAQLQPSPPMPPSLPHRHPPCPITTSPCAARR